MLANDVRKKELSNRLIEAVKQCQTRFGARHEIAGDSDNSVIYLLTAWENVLNDCLVIESDESAASIAMLNTMSRLASNIPLIGDTVSRTTTYTVQQLRPPTSVSVSSVSFYSAVREVISESERRRFETLSNVRTPLGKARSFLRAALNEKTLERTVRKLLSSTDTLSRFYQEAALIRDAECSALLPSLAAGLDSVVFALSIDRPTLDAVPIAMMTVPTPIERGGIVAADSGNPDDTFDATRRRDGDQQSHPIAIDKSSDENVLRPRLAFGSLVELATSAFSTSFSSPSNTNAPIPLNEPVVVAVGIDTGRNMPAVQSKNVNKKRKRPTVISFDEEGQGQNDTERSETAASVRNELESSQPIRVTNGGATTNSSSSGIGSVEVNNGEITQVEAARNQDRDRKDDEDSDKTYRASPVAIALTSVKEATQQPPSFEEEPTATFSALSLSRFIPLQLAGSRHDEAVSSVSSSSSQAQLLTRVRTHDSINEEAARDDASDTGVHFQLENDSELITGSPAAMRGAPHGYTPMSLPNHSNLRSELSADALLRSTLSHTELKQALVAVIQRKEEAERCVTELRETVAHLEDQLLASRAQAEEERVADRSRADMDRQTVQTLRRENELLRTQLKKYIGTVQSLKRAESASGTQASTSESNVGPVRDYSFEAEQFEAKLVKMAELHGELLEFNDVLQRELRKREVFVRHVHRRLVELRGPLPPDEEQLFQSQLNPLWADEQSGAHASADTNRGARSPSTSSASSLSVVFPTTRPLVNIWIPNVYLIRDPHDVHHVFQIYTRVGDEEWNIFRRFSEFVAFHHRLVERERPDSKDSAGLRLPPKKAVGNRDAKFVEERRARLQSYLRSVVNYFLSRYPTLAGNVNKRSLSDKVPILDEAVRERSNTETMDSIAPSIGSGPSTSNTRNSVGSKQNAPETRSNRRSVADSIPRRSSQPVLQTPRSNPSHGFRT